MCLLAHICQPVSMSLELQPIGDVVHKIDMRRYVPKPAYFVKLVPCGLLPVIQLKGDVAASAAVRAKAAAALVNRRRLWKILCDGASGGRVTGARRRTWRRAFAQRWRCWPPAPRWRRWKGC